MKKDFKTILIKEIGHKLKKLRQEAGLTQEDVCKKSGNNITRSTLSNFEKGIQLPSLDKLYHVTQVLEIDIQNILPTYKTIADKVEVKDSNELSDILNKKYESKINSKSIETIDSVLKNLKI